MSIFNFVLRFDFSTPWVLFVYIAHRSEALAICDCRLYHLPFGSTHLPAVVHESNFRVSTSKPRTQHPGCLLGFDSWESVELTAGCQAWGVAGNFVGGLRIERSRRRRRRGGKDMGRECPPLQPTKESRERGKLPQQDPERSPGRKRKKRYTAVLSVGIHTAQRHCNINS